MLWVVEFNSLTLGRGVQQFNAVGHGVQQFNAVGRGVQQFNAVGRGVQRLIFPLLFFKYIFLTSEARSHCGVAWETSYCSTWPSGLYIFVCAMFITRRAHKRLMDLT